MGARCLRHLRNLEVTFAYYKGYFDTFQATFDPVRGLNAKVTESADWSSDPKDEDAWKHLAMIKHQKTVSDRETTGVLEFFVSNPDSLRTILYSPLYKLGHLSEDQPGYFFDTVELKDERNAYSIACGECYVACPW